MAYELDKPTVLRIAELARLRLSSEEVDHYQQELTKILQAFETLSQVSLPQELSGDARSALVLKNCSDSSDKTSRLQEDKVNSQMATQTFLSMVPEREGVFVRVPAILAQST